MEFRAFGVYGHFSGRHMIGPASSTKLGPPIPGSFQRHEGGRFREPRCLGTSGHFKRQVLAILYDGFEAAEQEPRLLGTVENKVSHIRVKKDDIHV
jgi:hypothetical protein